MRKFIFCLLATLLVATLLWGCQAGTPTPSAAPTARPTATTRPTEAVEEPATPAPTDTASPEPIEEVAEPTEEPPTAEPTVDAYPGWEHYNNADYGFSLRYPSNWQLADDANVLRLSQQTPAQTVHLRIAYRLLSEDVDLWGRTGIPAGELETRGTVTMLDHTVLKKVLVYEGKDKAVFYNGTQEIQTGELVFSISLEASQADYQTIELAPAVQTDVEKILSSLVQDNVKRDGWLTYINADYGFTFLYPETWLLLQDANFIRLSKDMSILNIRYRRITEDIADWGKAGLPAGDFETRGTSIVLGQEVPRETVVYEDKDKAVFYNGVGAEVRAGDLAFLFTLQDMDSDYLAAEITAALLSEVDRILGSLLLRGAATWTSSQAGSDSAGWTNYTNREFGFALSFPERWDGYKTTVEDEEQPVTVAFWFESLAPKNALVVHVFDPEAWEDAENQMVYLGESEAHVFAIEPYSPECTNMQAFQCERHKEIPAILETFALVEVSSGSASPGGTCSGGKLWLDAWPVSTVCTADGWSATIFAEGHGGDCAYTYYWKDEKVAGPVAGSFSFDVPVAGESTLIGEVTVESAGQSAVAPVYMTNPCP